MGSSVDHHLCDTGYQAGAENGRLEPSNANGAESRRLSLVGRGEETAKPAVKGAGPGVTPDCPA